MSVLVFDRIFTADSSKAENKRVPHRIAVLLAKAGVKIPDSGTIALAQVDKALNGLNVEERMRIKSELAELKLIA
jgi:hypothetical protein